MQRYTRCLLHLFPGCDEDAQGPRPYGGLLTVFPDPNGSYVATAP